LIDAGNNNDGVAVVTYLKKQGVNTIDLLVGTHPHEDHIGGLDTVINNLTIKEIYMPKVAHTSQTFKDVLTAIQAKNLTVTTPVAGSSINIDPSIKLEILAPNSQTYDDFNNYSIVLKLTYKNTSYLFTGDAEYTSENETLAKHKTSLNSDVLKVGHHGSNSSTSSAFLNAVSPKYAVISVGAGNSYGHPSELTIDSLNNAGVQIYRTDEVGTIISTSDGNVIMFDKNTSVIKPHAPPVHLDLDFDDDDDYDLDTSTSTSNLINDEDEEEESDNSQTVYVTNTGTKYHAAGCRHLSKSKIPISLSQAKQKYEPCSVCNPPR
jgi:competence protein ComEC